MLAGGAGIGRCMAVGPWHKDEAKREEVMAEANKRAAAAKPLTPAQSAEAKQKFLQVLNTIGSDVKDASATQKVRSFLTPYLGDVDACLLTQYISTGNRWSERSYGDQSTAEEDCCTGDFADLGVFGKYTALERTVEAAYQHAGVVFKNNKPVLNFLTSMGDVREAKKKAHEKGRDRESERQALEALGKGLQWGAYLVPAVLAGGLLWWIYLQGRKKK
jgi:hypothetical protein